VLNVANRIGGAATREMLVDAGDDAQPGVFYDFEYKSAPLSSKILHCPCYAHDGIVISMSMPDPPLGVATSNVQLGSRMGSVGLLLPGFYVNVSADGLLTVKGPALPEKGITLPSGSALDERGFLSISPNEL